jgi:hypothetical protein
VKAGIASCGDASLFQRLLRSGEVGATFEHRSTRHTSRKHNATAQAVKGNFGGFCVSPHAQKTTPARVACRGRLCRNSRLGGMGASRPAEVLALGYWVGRESSLRPGAFARLACCGRPLPASRAAQPWSSRVPAWVVAIGSCKICGNA